MRSLTRLLLTSCMVLAVLVPAAAQARGEDIARYFREQSAKQATVADGLRASIASRDGEVQLAEHEAYCRAVGWVIYYGFNGYSTEQGKLPQSLQDLVSTGWLDAVPQNLLAGREMRLLTPGEGVCRKAMPCLSSARRSSIPWLEQWTTTS